MALDDMYSGVAEYYDQVYDLKEDIPFYIEYANKQGSPILELGCGTGRVAIPIAQAGFEVWGIDISEEMLAVARKKMKQLDNVTASRMFLRKGDMRNFSLPKKFNLIIIPFRSFLILKTKKEQEDSLRCIRNHLTGKGILIIDVFAPRYDILAKGHYNKTEEKLDEESGAKIVFNKASTYDHEKQCINVHNIYKVLPLDGTIKEIHQKFTMRYTFRYEMEYLLEKEGFNIINIFGGFAKQPYDYVSGEMVFVVTT